MEFSGNDHVLLLRGEKYRRNGAHKCVKWENDLPSPSCVVDLKHNILVAL